MSYIYFYIVSVVPSKIGFFFYLDSDTWIYYTLDLGTVTKVSLEEDPSLKDPTTKGKPSASS